MTRQYKGMQEELLSRVRSNNFSNIFIYTSNIKKNILFIILFNISQINKLEETVQDLNDQLSESDLKIERIMKEKNAIIQIKDSEISELKSKMDDMAEEFGEMLRETLEKMRERIEISSGNIIFQIILFIIIILLHLLLIN